MAAALQLAAGCRAAARRVALRLEGSPACGAAGSVRRIRTGFFTEDPDYLDPEAPLLAERTNSRWRYMDDAALKASVLERSNVGMGMLVLNRPRGLDLPTINELYRRLRDLEVNSLKRFVGLTAAEPEQPGKTLAEFEHVFCLGLDRRELLLAATSARRYGELLPFSRALLWHQQELAHLVADYRKPLVLQVSGKARNGGAALAALANFSGVWHESEVCVDACFFGLVPDGGATLALARMPFNLGEFLALTGWSLSGADLVYAGLARHWMSHDALPFLELTSEKQLMVSESDARVLLEEHSLPVPDGGFHKGAIWRLRVPVVSKAFAQNSVKEIVEMLRRFAAGDEVIQGVELGVSRAFARECLQRMQKASPLALQTALTMVRKLKKDLASRDPKADAIGQHGEHGLLVEALRRELAAQQRLLATQDALLGLHAACQREADLGGQGAQVPWSRDINENLVDDAEALLEGGNFAVATRAEMPLAAHPRLRRYHPDYNPQTGLDHDPVWMAEEAKRWSPELFKEQREQVLLDLLDGADPSQYGLSRWVRVDP